MKKIIVTVLLFSIVLLAMAQTKKSPATKTPVKPALKSTTDSLSYAIGTSVAAFYKQQGITSVNTALIAQAINDVLKNGKPILTEQQCNAVIVGFVQKTKEEKASVNKKAGEAFLAENKKKAGVVSLPSGLQYFILKEGTGPKPADTSKVKVHYHGTLLDGTVFDSSIQRGQPIEFAVNGVIPGWTEALQLMPVGSKWRLFVPSNLAYGDQQAGPVIKPGSTLVFEVELLEIVK